MAEPGGPTCCEWYTWPRVPLRKTWGDDKGRAGPARRAKARSQDGRRLTVRSRCCPGWGSRGASRPPELSPLLAGPGRPGRAVEGGAGPRASSLPMSPHPAREAEPPWVGPLGARGGRAVVGRQAGHEKARVSSYRLGTSRQCAAWLSDLPAGRRPRGVAGTRDSRGFWEPPQGRSASSQATEAGPGLAALRLGPGVWPRPAPPSPGPYFMQLALDVPQERYRVSVCLEGCDCADGVSELQQRPRLQGPAARDGARGVFVATGV